jgi:hypothetical protein
VDQTSQAAIVKFPYDFVTGIMRGNFNPQDGQLYVAGLDGWNGGGRRGLRDQGIERVRYTGKPLRMVTDCQVEHDGLRLRFNFPLGRESASEQGAYSISQWNYQWRSEYGSDMYHPETGSPGTQDVPVSAVLVAADGKGVKLTIPKIRPVNQLHLKLSVKDRDGVPLEEEVYWTINRVPEK